MSKEIRKDVYLTHIEGNEIRIDNTTKPYKGIVNTVLIIESNDLEEVISTVGNNLQVYQGASLDKIHHFYDLVNGYYFSR